MEVVPAVVTGPFDLGKHVVKDMVGLFSVKHTVSIDVKLVPDLRDNLGEFAGSSPPLC